MLILEAVNISKKDRCESSLLPFAYHKLMYSFSNLISDYPPQRSLLPPRGFLRLRQRRLFCGRCRQCGPAGAELQVAELPQRTGSPASVPAAQRNGSRSAF